jgi:hypothetical protein
LNKNRAYCNKLKDILPNTLKFNLLRKGTKKVGLGKSTILLHTIGEFNYNKILSNRV